MNAESCVFCKIVRGEIPSRKIYEDADIFAFHDIHPLAPVHFMIIPKKHIESLAHCELGDPAMLGKMLALDGGRPVAVLDFETATFGQPEEDLAWFLFLDRHHSEGHDVPRLEGFPSHDATVARWQELTGRRADVLEPLAERLGGRALGVDLADPGFWEAGLDLVEAQLRQAEEAAEASGRL